MDTELRAHIISELCIERASPETQDATLNIIGELIMKELLLSVYETCSVETLKEIDERVEKGDMEELLVYIDEHIPESEELLKKASQKIIAQFKEKLTQAKSKTT
jgi:hypothetical protein